MITIPDKGTRRHWEAWVVAQAGREWERRLNFWANAERGVIPCIVRAVIRRAWNNVY